MKRVMMTRIRENLTKTKDREIHLLMTKKIKIAVKEEVEAEVMRQTNKEKREVKSSMIL